MRASDPPLSRRAAILGGLGLVGLAATTVLGGCSSGDAEPFPNYRLPSAGKTSTPSPGVLATSGQLTTRYWPGFHPTWILARPTAVARPPLVVSLHGKGGDAAASFTDLGLGRFVASTRCAVAAIDGGDYYWHARRSESTGYNGVSADTPPCNTGAMVTNDFIPMLARLGIDTSRLAFIGWSMGGYGALLLSATLGAAKVAAVAPMSAALWTEPGDSAPGAFDDAEDWAAHNVYAMRDRFRNLPVRLAVGTSDPFYEADKTFVDGFPTGDGYQVTGVYGPGGHDATFWAAQAGPQMRFLAQQLHARP